MTQSPAPPEVEHDERVDDIPVAETELEPPYKVIIHNDDITNPIQGCGVLDVAGGAGA